MNVDLGYGVVVVVVVEGTIDNNSLVCGSEL